MGQDTKGELRQESAKGKGERIIGEELKRLGWKELDLKQRRKSDPGKLQIAARLRRETILTIKSIAARLEMGTSKSANVNLHAWMEKEDKAQRKSPAHIPEGMP